LDVAGDVWAYRKVVEVGDPQEPEVKQAKSFLDGMAETIRKNEGVDLATYMASQDAFSRAFALMEQGDWERASAGFCAAAALNGRHAPAHGNMHLCLAKLGRKAEALKELDRATDIHPRCEPALSNWVAVEHMEKGKPLGGIELGTVDFRREQILRTREALSATRDCLARQVQGLSPRIAAERLPSRCGGRGCCLSAQILWPQRPLACEDDA